MPRLRLDPPLRVLLAMTVLVALAAYVRLAGTGWDGYAGLHPDERHMLFVSLDLMRGLDDPAHAGFSLSDWWFAAGSPLNPRSDTGGFVYGEAPYLAVTLLGWLTGNTGWDQVMILGRQVAAVLDALTVLAVFVMAVPLAGSRAAVLAAVLYAAVPTALQLSNFYTVDIWLVAAMAWSLSAVLSLARSAGPGQALRRAGLAGGLAGLALACKVTALALALPMAVALVIVARRSGWRVALLAALVAVAVMGISFRLANPFAFAGPGLFGLRLAPGWVADMASLAGMAQMVDFPPNWQWMAGYGPVRFLRDFALFGAGPVLMLLALAGLRVAGAIGRGPQLALASLAAVFVAQGVASSVPVLRYAAPALPVLAVLAAPLLARLPGLAALAVVALALWWGAGAVRLHDGAHPRVLASRWLWDLPPGTRLVNETGWDEALPVAVYLPGVKDKRWPGFEDHFVYATLEIVAPDSAAKATAIAAMIAAGDYVVISSGRQSEVMPRLPDRFPLTAAYYDMIQSGRACLGLVWQADRGYPLPLLPFNDRWAQETWRVYDHPVVRIYQRQPCFDAAGFAWALRAALPH